MKKMNERKKNPVRLLMCLLMMAMVIYIVHVKTLSTGIKKYVSLMEKNYKRIAKCNSFLIFFFY